jgi:pimeloyl-ACP methyl ester carboxylesterase
MEFIAERYRESTTYARIFWERPFDWKLARYLHRVKVPTLILWGEEDKIVPVQHLDTWRKWIPHAQTKVFKGAGHLVHLENPEVLEQLGKFIG